MIKVFIEELLEQEENILEIFPSHLEDRAWRLSLFGDKLEKIEEFDPLTGDLLMRLRCNKSLCK